MEMFALISASIALLISSIAGQEISYCTPYFNSGFGICRYSGNITDIYNRSKSQHLALNVEHFSSIASHAFKTVRITELGLGHPNTRTCTPKLIEITPESFDGLCGVNLMMLNCVKFPVGVKPFNNLQTLTSLWLQRVSFCEIEENLFTDLPHLKQLILSDVTIEIISPMTFSRISDELVKLRVEDKIRVLEAKSFERFYRLESLEVNNGQFSKLPIGALDGLQQLKNLSLARNAIQVIEHGSFASVTQLQRLSLNTNKIIKVEGWTFNHLNDLIELDLANNYLECIPYGVDNISNLKYLSLRSNRIKEIRMDSFRSLPKLQILDLADNEIHHIDRAGFRSLNLRRLSLGYNRIANLTIDAFCGLTVGFLDLDRNDINNIAKIAFRNLTARSISLCYRQWITQDDLCRWSGDGTDIKKINNLCGGINM